MAKSDYPPPGPPPLDPAHQALVTAMTDVFNSFRPKQRVKDKLATDAETQYGQIKATLRTHSEPIPKASTDSTASTASTGGTAATSSG